MFIFSYSKCSIKQLTDNDNYMAYEDLTSVSKVRYVSNPVTLIFQVRQQILDCNAAESRIICSTRTISGPANSSYLSVRCLG